MPCLSANETRGRLRPAPSSSKSNVPTVPAHARLQTPRAGAANTARIYAFEGAGDALTDLCAVFQDGSIDVFAQETTELDANVFRYPDGTAVDVKLRKDHRGEFRFVAVFPDGTEYNLEQHEYHAQEYIDANMGTVSDTIPDGWEIYDIVN